jgi:hypothetical protein
MNDECRNLMIINNLKKSKQRLFRFNYLAKETPQYFGSFFSKNAKKRG